MKPETVECWRCSNCGMVWQDKGMAEKCCVCDICGGPADKGYGGNRCRKCRDAEWERIDNEKWQKAAKVGWKDYDGEGVYIEGVGSEYFFPVPDPQEVIDFWESYNEESFPGFAALRIWGVAPSPIELDPDRLAEELNDGAYEDYEVSHEMYRDLELLCDEWNAKHGDKAYFPVSVGILYEEAR